MKKIIFGLGSNLGDKDYHLQKSISLLQNYLDLKNIKKSAIFKNPAMLPENSPESWNIEFFNMAISADINLEKFAPLKILEIVKKIEKEIGRKERERWSPREIDIDILQIEDLKIDIKDKLQIPHPGLKIRDFFIKTVAEIL